MPGVDKLLDELPRQRRLAQAFDVAIQHISVAKRLGFGEGTKGVLGFDSENIFDRCARLLLTVQFGECDGKYTIQLECPLLANGPAPSRHRFVCGSLAAGVFQKQTQAIDVDVAAR